jgi:hypothetical protein
MRVHTFCKSNDCTETILLVFDGEGKVEWWRVANYSQNFVGAHKG